MMLTYIFTNGNCIWKKPMNKIIDQHKIGHRIHISCQSKVFIVVSSETHLKASREHNQQIWVKQITLVKGISNNSKKTKKENLGKYILNIPK